VAIRIRDLDTDPDMDPDADLYCNTGKTCLGGGKHCRSASSLLVLLHDCRSASVTDKLYRLFD